MNLGLYYIITTIFHHDWIMTRGLALYFWFPNQFPVFVFGIALFFVFRNGRISKRAGTVLLWLSITAFLALALFKFDLAYPAYFFQREYVYAAVFTAFAIGAFASGSRLFSNALLQRIGTVSFSMYLNHFIVLYVMSWLVHMAAFLLIGKFGVPEPLLKNNAFFLLLYVLTAAAAFGLSTVTYRYIEKKGMELGENIIKILSKSTGTVAAVESIPGPGQAPVHEPPRAQ
jgi:peptidoglycan/LPS O-acetylase OafA/YrhL